MELENLKTELENKSLEIEKLKTEIEDLKRESIRKNIIFRSNEKKLKSIDTSLLNTITSNVENDLNTARRLLVRILNSTLENDIISINNLLNNDTTVSVTSDIIGTPSNDQSSLSLVNVIGGNNQTIFEMLGDPGDNKTLISLINPESSSIKAALDTISTKLSQNINYNQSLFNTINTINSLLNNNIVSLPSNLSYLTVLSISTSENVISLLTNDGVYTTQPQFPIPNNHTFNLTNLDKNITLKNTSGVTISSIEGLFKYLTCILPTGFKLSLCVNDNISNLKLQIGTSIQNLNSSIANIGSKILLSPSGVISNDFNSFWQLLMNNPGVVLETDINQIKTLLSDETGTLDSIIGNITENTGLFSCIGSGTYIQNEIFNSSINFNDSINLKDSLVKFIEHFNPINLTDTNNNLITFDCTTPPTSLAEILTKVTSTSSIS